jgi:hypothetical protein
MSKRINPEPDFKKAIRDIYRLRKLDATDFKKASMKIIRKVAFDEILDITIEKNEE